MKVIFLDFSGVLTSVASIIYHNRRRVLGLEEGEGLISFCPIACSNLEYILEECPEAQVVVSSDWRKDRTIEQLKKIFEENQVMPSRIIDTTPELEQYEEDGKDMGRGSIISTYLKAHPEVTHFVIIDDEDDMKPYMSHLVKVNSSNGLTFTDAEKVIEMIGGSSEEKE